MILGRYLGASVAALAVDYTIYLLLLRLVPGLSPVGAAVPGYVAGIVVHYGLSRRFVFPAGWLHGRPLGEFLLFLLTGAVGTAVTALVVWLVSRVPGSGVHWPKVAAIVTSFLATYLLRKLFVFRRSDSDIAVMANDMMSLPRLPFDPARLPPATLLRWAVAVAAAIGAYDVLTIVLFLSGGPLIGPPRWVLFPDFLVFHAGARAVLEGHPTTAFGFDSFIAYFNSVFADRLPMYVGYRPYLYPPTWLLLSTPLALVPVAVSFGLFMALSAGLVAWFVCRRNWIVGLLVLSSPAALWTMVSGQNSFLNAALFYGGFWLVVARRPVAGGILLGLIACKPQLWVLVPVVLLAGGQGRALLATLATAALLAVASLAVLGPGTWLAYLDLAREASSARRIEGMFETAGNYMTTVLAGARIVGLSSATALILHLAVAVCATAAAWAVARHRPWTEAHVAAFAAATLLISPYNINYDMLLLMPGAALLFRQRVLEGRLLPFEPVYLLGLWLIPNLLIRFNQHHLPVTPALVAVLLGLAWLTVRTPCTPNEARMVSSRLRPPSRAA